MSWCMYGGTSAGMTATSAANTMLIAFICQSLSIVISLRGTHFSHAVSWCYQPWRWRRRAGVAALSTLIVGLADDGYRAGRFDCDYDYVLLIGPIPLRQASFAVQILAAPRKPLVVVEDRQLGSQHLHCVVVRCWHSPHFHAGIAAAARGHSARRQ